MYWCGVSGREYCVLGACKWFQAFYSSWRVFCGLVWCVALSCWVSGKLGGWLCGVVGQGGEVIIPAFNLCMQ